MRLAFSILLGVLLWLPLGARAAEVFAANPLGVLAREAFYDQAWAETERLSGLGLADAEKRFGADSAEAGLWMAGLADAMCRADATPVSRPWTDRAHTQALPIAKRAVEILEKAYGPKDLRTAEAYMAYTVALAGLYRHPEGDPYGRRVLDIVEHTPAGDPDHDLLILKLFYYAAHLHIVDHNVEAQEYEERTTRAQYGKLIDPPRVDNPNRVNYNDPIR